MKFSRVLSVGGIVAVIGVSTIAWSDESETGEVAPKSTAAVGHQPEVDTQLLDDLSRIRRRMGGGVLQGTSLNDLEASEQDFRSGLQGLLQTEVAPAQPAMQRSFFAPAHGSRTQQSTRDQVGEETSRTRRSEVATLRKESVRLGDLANQLEELRLYQLADDLRASAQTLRHLSRRLDARPHSPSASSDDDESMTDETLTPVNTRKDGSKVNPPS